MPENVVDPIIHAEEYVIFSDVIKQAGLEEFMDNAWLSLVCEPGWPPLGRGIAVNPGLSGRHFDSIVKAADMQLFLGRYLNFLSAVERWHA